MAFRPHRITQGSLESIEATSGSFIHKDVKMNIAYVWKKTEFLNDFRSVHDAQENGIKGLFATPEQAHSAMLAVSGDLSHYFLQTVAVPADVLIGVQPVAVLLDGDDGQGLVA
jgi:hypothetical protein